MPANESEFCTEVMKAFKKLYTGSHFNKTNDNCTLGVPDLRGTVKGRSVTLEAKLYKGKEKLDTIRLDHPFNPAQRNYLKKEEKAGAVSFGVIGTTYNVAYLISPKDIEPNTHYIDLSLCKKFGKIGKLWDVNFIMNEGSHNAETKLD